MAREIGETAEACGRQVEANGPLMRELGARLRQSSPPFVATLARGSSDHAASFAKVLFELRCATPTLSHAPSVGALYQATSPRFAGVPLLAISQSGRSPDLIAAADDARRRGALQIALVNDTSSPLAQHSDLVIPLHAGAERSVAATKTFIATLVALTHLAAEWSEDAALLSAVRDIGDTLARQEPGAWMHAGPALRDAERLLVLGRGYTLPIAAEAALKLKEVAGLHAEAFSIAEVAHGPMTLVGSGDPVLVFAPVDAAREGLDARLADFADRGATVISRRPVSAPDCDPAIAAIVDIIGFYRCAEAVARARGRNPDLPPHLAKVTRTL